VKEKYNLGESILYVAEKCFNRNEENVKVKWSDAKVV